ncbi:MAG: CpaD family pilus assembly lipoprotein [Pseudomonadota bacterium]
MTPVSTLKIASAVALAALVAGCSTHKRDSFTVGSVPNDYRTTHPILIAEGEKNLDVPVAASSHELAAPLQSNIRGFGAMFKRSGSGMMYMLMPAQSANAGSAARARTTVLEALEASGVPRHKVMIQNYDASQHGASAPIRLAFKQITASTHECGRWNSDLSSNSENTNYANFGCATQSNLAAAIENPGDLMAPRASTPIDAARRGAVYEEYLAAE